MKKKHENYLHINSSGFRFNSEGDHFTQTYEITERGFRLTVETKPEEEPMKKEYKVTEELIRYYWPDACGTKGWVGEPIRLANIASRVENDGIGLDNHNAREFFRRVLEKEGEVFTDLAGEINTIKRRLCARLDKLKEEKPKVVECAKSYATVGRCSHPWAKVTASAIDCHGKVNYYPERPVEDLAKWLHNETDGYISRIMSKPLAEDLLEWIANHDKAVVR